MNVQMLVRIGLLYLVKKIEIVYFVSLAVEHVPEEIKEFIGNKKKTTQTFSKYNQTIQ